MLRAIKKISSILASALFVLILSGFLSLQPLSPPTVFAASATCKNITHAAPKILTDATLSSNLPDGGAGIANAGQIDFNQPADPAYQACTEQNAVQPTKIDMKGWAWNTNLGYISFYCNGGQNLGADCKGINPPIDYSTIIARDTGALTGFSWNDSVGWISMSCQGGFNQGVGCGGVNYQVKVAKVDGESTCQDPVDPGRTIPVNVGDMYGYAWNDSVGWVNFCGARTALTPPPVPSVIFSNPETVRYATGNDYYKIVIQFKIGERVLEDISGYSVLVKNLEWTDNLRADQITRCNPLDRSPGVTAACNYNAAIKPAVTDFVWDPAEKGLVGNIASIAPTTSGLDKIILESLIVEVDGIQHELKPRKIFAFAEPVTVKKIEGKFPNDQTEEDMIVALRDNNSQFNLFAGKTIQLTAGHSLPADNLINIYTQLHDCDSQYEFWLDSAIPRTHDLGTDADRPNIDRENRVCPTLTALTLADIDAKTFADFLPTTLIDNLNTGRRSFYIYSTPQAGSLVPASSTTDNALGLATRIEYTTPASFASAPNRSVRYFSKMLIDGSVVNQAAQVAGNVRVDIQKMLREGAVAQSIGNNPRETQQKREKFYKAIKKSTGTALSSTSFAITSTTSLNNLMYYTSSSSAVPCKIIMNAAAGVDLNYINNSTIVAEGCDVYIDNNIYPAVGRTGRIGIIALEKFSITGSRRGGNIYICHRVTDIEANIVADGSIFGYGANETDCGPATSAGKDALIDQATGIPNPLGTKYTARRQLTITGSILTDNTYGGSFLNPPILGDGTAVTNSADLPKAKMYDLNYLRYGTTEINASNNICWATGVALSKKYNGGTGETNCANNHPVTKDQETGEESGHAIVNIIYSAPSKDMAIFKEVK